MRKQRPKSKNEIVVGQKLTQPISIEDKFHLAIGFFQTKKFTNAKNLLTEILSFDPCHSESWFYSALIAEQSGLHEDAIHNLRVAIEIDPNNFKYLYTIGDIYYSVNYFNEGIKIFEYLIKIAPDDPNGYYNLAGFYQKQKEYNKALLCYYKVLELDGDNINTIYNIGSIFFDIKNHNKAIEYFQTVIEVQPDSVDALNNLGFLCMELNDIDDAIIYLNRAILLSPDDFNVLINLGKAYEIKYYFLESIKFFDKAISLNPDHAEAYYNRGVVFDVLLRYKEAFVDYDKAIALNPELAGAHYNKSLILLLRGDFFRGWELYKWRWKINSSSFEKFNTKIPHWDGINNDKSLKIFLWAEQGIGDEIFYFGMLKNFSNITSKVIATADNRLHGIFKRSMPEVEFIDRKKIDIEFIESSVDYQAPMGDLGHLCSVDKVIDTSRPKPFLSVNSFCKNDIKINNTLTGNILCGLSWKSANKDVGLSKSLNLIELAPLLLIENLEFVSLQYGSTKDEIEFVEKSIGKKIHTVDGLDLYNDIDGLVSLIDKCDFVVTTSNVSAHLTGSIGKKGIVLLPFSKGKIWYWHSGIGQSLWYPSLEMVSQINMNDWTDPIQKCKEWVLRQI